MAVSTRGILLVCGAHVVFDCGHAVRRHLALTAASIRASTPERRLAAIIGDRAAANSKIERLHVVDSFNEGETAWGVIAGPRDLLETIAQDRSHEVRKGAPPDARLRHYFPQLFPQSLDFGSDEENLEVGDQAADGRSVFYLQPATGKIYFARR